MSDKINAILEAVALVTVAEAAELKEKFKEKFGVTFPQTSGPTPVIEAAPVEEQTHFELILAAVGPNKVDTLKVMREVFKYGLLECKNAAEALPHTFPGMHTKAEAQNAQVKFSAVGAVLQLK